MHLLYDTEIIELGKKAEEFIRHQRTMMSLFKNNKKFLESVVKEDALEISKYLLKDIHHLEGDVERLRKVVSRNMQEMEWYYNNT